MPTLLGLTGYDRPYFAFGRDVLRETDREPMVSNYAGGTYQGITDSLVLFFDGERTLSAYLRSDTLQKNDISGIRTPALEAAERDLKARLQQYYRHVKQKDLFSRIESIRFIPPYLAAAPGNLQQAACLSINPRMISAAASGSSKKPMCPECASHAASACG